MYNELEDFTEKLTKIALQKSTPFCYSCYRLAPADVATHTREKGGKCLTCGSDDLMRHVTGVGIEYGTSWVIDAILVDALDAFDENGEFESCMTELYCEPVKICGIELDQFSAFKMMYNSASSTYRCYQSDWLYSQEESGNIISFDNGNTYYHVSDVEKFIEANLMEEEARL